MATYVGDYAGGPTSGAPKGSWTTTPPGGIDANQKYTHTQYNYDPTQQFISSLIGQGYASGQGTVSPTVLAGIEQMVSNPGAVGNIAGSQFAAIAQPLLQQQQEGFKIQQQNMSDMFRKAGVGTQQSGAFAQSARQLVGDQGRQQQTLLASNYIPLAGQLSGNMLGGINAGLKVPDANMGSLANILNAYGRTPTSVDTQEYGKTGQNMSPTVVGSFPGPSTISHMPSPTAPWTPGQWSGY